MHRGRARTGRTGAAATGCRRTRREEQLGTASRLVARGRLAEAIEIHRRVLAERPDARLINLTGDLLVRAEQPQGAIAHFLRAAEHWAEVGFTAKARAVYGKVLRLDPLSRPALAGLAVLEAQSVEPQP